MAWSPKSMRYFSASDLWASLRWVLGGSRKRFESEFARYVGAKHALGTSFGRTSLYLGLRALGVQGREVVIPDFTCHVVRQAVAMAGAKPVFSKIEFDTFDFSICDLEKKIGSRTAAVLLTHYFGRAAGNLEEVAELCRKRGVHLVEDCAHSLGAVHGSRMVGTFGIFSIFSLTKNMINFGGGMLVTNDTALHSRAAEVLNGERVGFLKRIADFPLVLGYGAKQVFEKIFLDRFRSWRPSPEAMIESLLKTRRIVLRMLRSNAQPDRSEASPGTDVADGGSTSRIVKYPEGIHMEPIIASIGRNQLRKLSQLTARRRRICGELSLHKLRHFHVDPCPDGSVCAHMVFRFDSVSMARIKDFVARDGWNLQASWPARTVMWDGQDPSNLSPFADSLLTWAVQPDTSDPEIAGIAALLKGVSESEGVQAGPLNLRERKRPVRGSIIHRNEIQSDQDWENGPVR